MIALAGEQAAEGAEALLEVVMMEGARTADRSSIEAAARRFQADVAALPENLRTLRPERYEVRRSPALDELAESVREQIVARELG